MSAFQPFIDLPYPNYAAEAAAQPYEAGPVESVTPVSPVRPVEPEESRIADEYPTPADLSEISRAARERSEQAYRNARQRRAEEQDRLLANRAPLDANRIRNNQGIRELIQSFENYNNQAAVNRYNAFLGVFVRYGANYVDSGEEGAVANLRAQENQYYEDQLAVSDNVTRANREGISQAIDRWFVGEGVFFPAMLNYTSSDGFRFTPLSAAARPALRAADVMSTYDRNRIANYLRELAGLTPRDFMFYDPTGLGALPLEQRRDFLRRVQETLDQERIEARAAELRYAFNQQNQIDIDLLGLEDREELERLRRDQEAINTYYGQLLASVHQYKAGIVSEALV